MFGCAAVGEGLRLSADATDSCELTARTSASAASVVVLVVFAFLESDSLVTASTPSRSS